MAAIEQITKEDPEDGIRPPSVSHVVRAPGGPRVLVGGFSEPGYRRAARLAEGFIHGGGAPEQVKATFDHIRDLRRQMDREGPFEFWAQVSAPRDREGWQRALDSYQAAGADGLIVDAGRGVLEIIR